MRKGLVLTLLMAGGLALLAGEGWAGTASLLADRDLANIWAGQPIENFAEAVTSQTNSPINLTATQSDQGSAAANELSAAASGGSKVARGGTNSANAAGSNNTVNRASGQGSIANGDMTVSNNTLSGSNGISLLVTLQSQNAVQSNVATWSGAAAVTTASTVTLGNISQTNTATISR